MEASGGLASSRSETAVQSDRRRRSREWTQVVTRHGREVAVLLSIEEYRRLRGADLSDPLTAGPRYDAFAQILNDIVDERTGDVPGDIP